MPGSPKKRARREALEREAEARKAQERQLRASADSQSSTLDAPAPSSPVPTVPLVEGEVLAPAIAAQEPTRTALKRAMRARAQEHAEAAIAVLVRNLESKDARIATAAANDLLAWGFGKPAQEIEAGEGTQMIVIRKFSEEAP